MPMADLAQRAAQSSVPALRIDLFGGLAIYMDGRRIPDLATRKAEALLIYLACHPQPHHREALAELFWDDLAADRAAGNLRLILNQLRQHFAPFLDVTRQTIGLRGDISCLVDVHAFARILAGKPQDMQTIAGALELYRGDFLQGFHAREARGFSAWQAAQAEQWRRLALAWMQRLIDLLIAYSRYDEARTWALRLLHLEPLDEAAHRRLMLLHARSGQRQAAICQYQACRQVLREEMGLDPEPDTEALYQRIRNLPEQRPHTLPPCPLAPLGRAAELARVYEWLAAPARLMSIVGPGGSGKTHLALTVGWRVVHEYLGPCSDGVFYLAVVANDRTQPRTDDTQLLMEIAKTLGVTLSGKSGLLDQLIQHLHNKEILLIVDNGELLDSSARLALGTLVRHTPAVRVLTPSRERLKLREEHVLLLEGLSYPRLPTHATTPRIVRRFVDSISAYASVQLFLARASRLQEARGFEEYDRVDQVAIGRICQIVHGLPLAIELVTPWLHIRSPAEILHDLTRTIDLLAADMPDVPERHRSIRAVFDHSWRLLSEREHAALARLAVFPESFNAQAAEAIAAVALPLLALLHDKSLLHGSKTETETRYSLHPLLRHLALEKLQIDATAEAAARDRHARYFAAFAAQREDRLHVPQGADTLRALEREIENLRAGWRWAIATYDIETLGRSSIALHDFCTMRGWELEGRMLFQSAAGAIHEWLARESDIERAIPAAVRVLSCYAGLEYTLGNLNVAEDIFHECHTLLTPIAAQDMPRLLYIYKQLGMIAYQRGSYDLALQHLQFTLQLAEAGTDMLNLGNTLLSLGFVALTQGDERYAEQTLQRCLSVFRSLGSEWGIGHALRFMGMLAAGRDDEAAALRYYQESLALMEKLGHRLGEALALDQLGLLYLAKHQLDQSAGPLQQALGIFQELGVDSGTTRALCYLGRLALAGQDYKAARQYFLQALDIAQHTQTPALQVESAAGALHLLVCAGEGAVIQPRLCAVLDWLERHPACPADTRRYIRSFALDRPVERAHGADTADQPRTLEQARDFIVGWMHRLVEERSASGGNFVWNRGGIP